MHHMQMRGGRGTCLQRNERRESVELPGAVWARPLQPCIARRNGSPLEFPDRMVVLWRVGT